MRYLSSVLFLIALILVSCTEDDSGMNMAPTMTVSEATNITRTACTLSANIANDKGRSIKESGFIYSTSKAFQDMSLEAIRNSSAATIVPSTPVVTNGAMQQAVTSLSPNTTYYYCGYVSSGYSEVRTEVKSFTTVAETAPVLSNLTVTDVTISSATLSFELIDFGGEDQIDVLEIWYKKLTDGSTPTSLVRNECTPVDASGYTASIDELNINTRYAACAYIHTTNGRTANSAVTIFTTDNVDVKFTNFSTNDGGTSFQAQCSIDTKDNIVEKGVCYGRDIKEPTIVNNKKADESSDMTKISVLVEGLNDKATYYVRPYVLVNKKGKEVYVYGETKTATVSGEKVPLAEFNDCVIVAVTSTSITVSCSLKEALKVQERGFCYVKGKGKPSQNDNPKPISTTGDFKTTLTGLDPNTEYTICAYAITETGSSCSAPVSQITSKKTPSSDDNPYPGKQ